MAAADALKTGASTGAVVGTAVGNPLAGSIIGAGAGVGIDTLLSDRSRRMDQADYEKNQAQNFRLSQMAQRQAASNEVAGLRAAGLSPALAAGASPASVPAAPLQNKQVPQLNVGMAQLLSSINLQNQQAQNIAADTKSKEIDNSRKQSEDETWSMNLKSYFENQLKNTDPKDKEKVKFYEDMIAQVADKGSGAALLDYFALLDKDYDVRANIIEHRLRAYIDEIRWSKVVGHTADSSKFVADLAYGDARKSREVVENIAKIMAETENLKLMKSVIENQGQLTEAQVNQMKALTKQIEDTDIKQLIDKGDYKGAFMAGLILIFRAFAGRGASYVSP